MTDFFFPERFDVSLAEEGEWFEVVDENENVWGEFKCLLVDQTLPHYKVAIERLNRKYNTGSSKRKKKPGDDFAAELLVTMSLRDWKLNDAKGKPITYTPELAMKYFTNPKGAFVLTYLSERISDVRHFQTDEQNEAGEGDVLGN